MSHETEEWIKSSRYKIIDQIGSPNFTLTLVKLDIIIELKLSSSIRARWIMLTRIRIMFKCSEFQIDY